MVRKVRSRKDGILGALKELESKTDNAERRARLAREVFALTTLEGAGVPKVLDHNTHDYRNSQVELYAVMEWIDGPTLTERVSGNPMSIDESVSVALGLASTLGKCHNAKILHRDVKPDNIILRNGNLSEPILVDFGLAWQEDSELTAEFRTGRDEDLSSRFLRLPEAAPGMHAMDEKSDVAGLVGVLFYMVTGLAPRQLEDSKGLLPHEALSDMIPNVVKADKRWVRLSRIFRVGFQVRINQRFQTAQQLEVGLKSVNAEAGSDASANMLREESEKLTELFASTRVKLRDETRDSMSEAHTVFLKQFTLPSGMVMGGSGPNASDFGRRIETHFFVMRQGYPDIKATFSYTTVTDGTSVSAYYNIDGGAPEEYYQGRIADKDSLIEAAVSAGVKCCAGVLAVFRRTFESRHNQRNLADVFGP